MDREYILNELAIMLRAAFGADEVHIQLVYSGMEADAEIGNSKWEEFLTQLRSMQSSQ